MNTSPASFGFKMLCTYFVLIFIFFIRGTSLLTCSFDNGLCGWRNPHNAEKKWELNKGTSQHIVTPYSGLISFPFTVRLIYPNFTGSGFLSFSYCKQGLEYTTLRLFVGRRKLLNLEGENDRQEPYRWHFVTIPINSANETVIIEGTKTTARWTGQIAMDNIVFSEKPVPSLRLRGGGSTMAGIVEILLGGSWSSICKANHDITNIEARVACRSLGHEGQAWILKSLSYKMFEDSWMVLKGCRGNEKTIANCRRFPIRRYGCPSQYILAVACGSLSCAFQKLVSLYFAATIGTLEQISFELKRLGFGQ